MKYLVGLMVLIFVLGGFILVFTKIIKPSTTNNQPTTLPTGGTNIPTSSTISNCPDGSIKLEIDPQGAAGNIYAGVKATNISTSSCNIILGNSISGKYNANNVSTNYMDKNAVTSNYLLNPNMSVYSQIHVPNGPQCSTQTKNVSVDFVYDGNIAGTFSIQACQLSNEQTVIDIWPVSTTPINQ